MGRYIIFWLRIVDLFATQTTELSVQTMNMRVNPVGLYIYLSFHSIV